MNLLLVGFNTRALADSASRGGYRIVSIDCFGDLDHGMTCSVYTPRRPPPGYRGSAGTGIEEVTRLAMHLRGLPDAWNSFVYASGYENRPDCVEMLRSSGAALLGNDPDVLKSVRDFVLVSASLRKAGFKVPLTYAAEPGQFRPGPGLKGRKWLGKPAGAGGGRDVAFVGFNTALPHGYIIQEFIAGRQCSLSFLADGKNCVLLGITEQIIGSAELNHREFGYVGNILPLDLTGGGRSKKRLFGEAVEIARWLTEKYGLTGLNGVDFIFDGENCWVVEINPRYSASMELIEAALKISLLKLHIEACRGKLPHELERYAGEMFFKAGFFWGKKIVYAPRKVKIAPNPGGLRDMCGDSCGWARWLRLQGVRDIPFPGEIISRGSPVATAIACGRTRNQCVEGLDALAGLVGNMMIPAGR